MNKDIWTLFYHDRFNTSKIVPQKNAFFGLSIHSILLIDILVCILAGAASCQMVGDLYYPIYNGDGDYDDIILDCHERNITHPGSSCINISYSANRSQGKGWAEICWLYPEKNWGDRPGRDLTWPRTLTFWARGNEGGEKAEFRVGGIKGRYSDTLNVSTVIYLSKSWQPQEIDLSNYDRSNVCGGLRLSFNISQNPNGCIIYLDNLHFEEGPKASPDYYYEYRLNALLWKDWRDPTKYTDTILLATCGFGVRPLYTLFVGFLVIILFGFIYRGLTFRRRTYINALFLSARIFFAHNVPTGSTLLADRKLRYVVLLEDIFGWFLLAIFIVAVGKVVIWSP